MEIKETIWYLGKELIFRCEVLTIDEAQFFLDDYRERGFTAACTHEHGMHQVYAV